MTQLVDAPRTLALFAAIWRASRTRTVICLFVASLALFLSNGRIVAQIDSGPNSLLPIALMTRGALTFDGLIEPNNNGRPPDAFLQTRHGIASLFPIAAGIVALPIYAGPVAVKALIASPSPAEWVSFGYHFQKIAAAIIAAITVVAFWQLCELLGMSRLLSLGLVAFFALGSEIFSIGAQSLWQHGPGTLAIISAVYAQVRLRRRPSIMDALFFSAWCGLAVAIRPSNIVILASFALAALWQRPRLILPLVGPAVVILALTALYNLHFFADPLGGYAMHRHHFSLEWLPQGTAGLLFSPSRGLLIYFPAALVAAGLLLAKPKVLSDLVARAMAASVLLTIPFMGSYVIWWGGYSYGPRMLSEIEPLILLLLGLAWPHFSATARRPLAIACFGIMLPYTVMVQAVGVYSVSAWKWNGAPVDVLLAPERLWDFVDSPIARGLQVTGCCTR
jgi:hypothetical protein